MGTDTLVLKIVEYLDGTPDNKIYILYDNLTDEYVLRGKRLKTSTLDYCEYSFVSNSTSKLADFIEFMLDSQCVSYILYNYDNLPATSEEITYQFLRKYDDPRYEISGYDHRMLKRKELKKNLNMLRSIFNHYEPVN